MYRWFANYGGYIPVDMLHVIHDYFFFITGHSCDTTLKIIGFNITKNNQALMVWPKPNKAQAN